MIDPQHLHKLWDIAQESDPEAWCDEASDFGSQYLNSAGVRADVDSDTEQTDKYGEPIKSGFKGCTHSWIRLKDGTIVDPTVSQFQNMVGEWPHHPEVPNVAVVPPGHPFADNYVGWQPESRESSAMGLYHFTDHGNLESILKNGLNPGDSINDDNLGHVYLTSDPNFVNTEVYPQYAKLEVNQQALDPSLFYDYDPSALPIDKGTGVSAYRGNISPEHLRTVSNSLQGRRFESSESDMWHQGFCGEYAAALQRQYPHLRIGWTGGTEPHDDDDTYYINHVFAHDDNHAYDNFGKHPLDGELYGDEGVRVLNQSASDLKDNWPIDDKEVDSAAEHLRTVPSSSLPTDYLDSREAKQWLPHPDETDEYMRGQCAAWADAHQDEYPHLRFGVDWERMTPDHPSYKDYKEDMGEDPEDGEWWRPQHYFTHDDNHWYDVEGAHPLSELPQWDRHTLNEDNVWFHGDLESGYKPDPEWVRRYAPVPKQSSSDWYHVAPKAYRESILKNGIQPNQQEGFSGSDFGDHLYGLQGHEQPVYLTKNPNFVGIDIENDPSDYDVWKVKPQKPLLADVGSLIEHGFELGDDDEMYPTKYTNNNHPELANMFPDDHELANLDHPGVIDYTGTAAHPGGIDPEHIELANQKQSAATQNKLIEQSKDLPDQSEVLHEWPDGWSIRQPKTFLDHHREGVLMSNCYDANHPDRHWLWNQYEPDTVSTPPNNMGWTEYIDQEMNKPATRLHGDQVQTYSLRDPDNIPHMTVDPELVNAGVASNPWGALGRHNSEPKPEYLNRWKESLKAQAENIKQSAETTQQLAERLRPNTNKIVAQHPNGWTIQQPQVFGDLDAIGSNMGNCWGKGHAGWDHNWSQHPDWPAGDEAGYWYKGKWDPETMTVDGDGYEIADANHPVFQNLDPTVQLPDPSRYWSLHDPSGVPRLAYDDRSHDEILLGRHNSEPKPEYQQIWDELKPQIQNKHFEASQSAEYPSDDDLKGHLGDSDCYDIAHGIESQWPHLKANGGYYIKDDGSPADHYWNRHPDGTIVDATSQQFGNSDNLIDPSHPSYDRYVSYEHEPEQAQVQAHRAGHHKDPEDYKDCPECSNHFEASMQEAIERYSGTTRKKKLEEAESRGFFNNTNKTVHQFDDGWSVQAPQTRDDKIGIGIEMSNCWGDGQEESEMTPYPEHPDYQPRALCDQDGLPHTVWYGDNPKDVIGRHNSPPKPEHWDHIEQYAPGFKRPQGHEGTEMTDEHGNTYIGRAPY